MPVKRWNEGKFEETVGYIKCIYNQLHLFGNRTAVIQSVNCDDYMWGTQKDKNAVWPGKSCHGVSEAWFNDL